jgi:hypothetical protein
LPEVALRLAETHRVDDLHIVEIYT